MKLVNWHWARPRWNWQGYSLTHDLQVAPILADSSADVLTYCTHGQSTWFASLHWLRASRKKHIQIASFLSQQVALWTIDWSAIDLMSMDLYSHWFTFCSLRFTHKQFTQLYYLFDKNHKIDQLSIVVIEYCFNRSDIISVISSNLLYKNKKKQKNFVPGWDRTRAHLIRITRATDWANAGVTDWVTDKPTIERPPLTRGRN